MKKIISVGLTILICFVGAIMPSSAFAKEDPKRDPTVKLTLGQINKEFKSVREQISMIETILKRIDSSVDSKNTKNMKDLSARTGIIEVKVGRLISRIDNMRARADVTFAAWDAEIAKITKKALLEENAQDREKRFNRYQQFLVEVEIAGTVFWPYLDNLYKIRDDSKILGEGEIDPALIKKAENYGIAVQEQIDRIIEFVDQAMN